MRLANIAAICIFSFIGGSTMAGIQPASLRTEYLENPLGIGETSPRLSWALESSEKSARGQSQTAYRILVAGSEENLQNDANLLWDTGKIDSDRTAHIRYAGKSVASEKRHWWKVKAWDEKEEESQWSNPAWWEMGLLDAADWSADGNAAQWLSIDHEKREDVPAGQWLWHPEGRGDGHSYYWGSFPLDAGKPVTAVTIRACIEDDGEVFINGTRLTPYRGWRRRKDYDITDLVRAGENAVAMEAYNRFGHNGALCGVLVEYQDGSSGRFSSGDSWKVVEEAPEGWTEADFVPDGWLEPKTGTDHFKKRPWGKMHMPATFPSPLLRKDFDSAKQVKQARAYISGLGYYELFLNGSKIGDHVLKPMT